MVSGECYLKREETGIYTEQGAESGSKIFGRMGGCGKTRVLRIASLYRVQTPVPARHFGLVKQSKACAIQT